MDLLRLITNDFELTVRADGVDHSFRRARQRNHAIEASTNYRFYGDPITSFELVACVDLELRSYLVESSLGQPLHPVFFENKDYYFDVVFKNSIDTEPFIYSTIQDVKNSFISRKVNGTYFLTGIVNYGNDIGSFDFVLAYKRDGKHVRQKLTYEVFPIKLDFKSDYKSIIADINKEFSALVFDVLKKTYAGFNEGNEINNDLIWWSVFGQLYQDILRSAKIILNKPHNRLIKENYYSKADRIKALNPLLEEEIAIHRGNFQKYYQVERKNLTVNTFENQFFKYSISFLRRKYLFIRDKLLKGYGLKVTDEFKTELEDIDNELSRIANHAFFKQIGDYKGMRQESLVLQKAPGYSSLFKSWIILKRGIDFLDGVNKIELKNIADLYQIWCFIEMKNMVQQILGKDPVETNLAEILIDGFTIQLRSGRNSKVTFKKENGDLVELFHELKYSSVAYDNNLTHTVNQEPDIVLRITKNDLKENLKFTYLFDAKYRLISDDTEDANDYPPDDAINQMHRYRDAIYYQENFGNTNPKKEVIGAYVLFPGANMSDEVEQLYFQKSIHKVNIGAYPLIPGSKKMLNNSLLKDFLENTIEVKESSDVLKEDIIPYKALKYEDPDALVLSGFLRSDAQRAYFSKGSPRVYHIPVQNTIKYLSKLRYFCPIIDGVSEYYEIRDIKLLPRKDIFETGHPLHKDSSDSYLVFEIQNKVVLPRKVETAVGGNRVFRYARLSELSRCKTINEFNKAATEVD